MKRIALLLTMVMLLVLLVACGEPAAEKYTVNFVANGETIASVEYEEGTVPTAPTVEGYETLNMVYTFSGWDKEIVAVTEDVTYTATYTGASKEFDVTFVYGGSTEGVTVKVTYGAFPDAPTTGLDYETAQYVYTFAGWDKQINAATENVTYTARYTSVLQEYDVTFTYGNPASPTTVTTTYKYGETPVAPTENLVYHTDTNTYLFNAWDKTVAAVTEDVTYTATYTETIRKYLITLKYDGKTETVECDLGSTPTLPTPAATYTDADKGLTYTFMSWDKAAGVVSGDDTYTALYKIVIFDENFDDEADFNVEAATKAFGAWSFTLKTGSYVKSRVDANAPSNKFLEFGGAANADAVQIGMKNSTGLTMDGRTKLTISFDLGLKDGVKLSDSYIRFRSTTSKYLKFLVTAQSDNSISFCGTKLKDGQGNLIALSETLKNFKMEFDFAAGKASISVDGVVIVADADLYANAATGWTDGHGTDMNDYISKCTQYIFQWAVNKKSTETGMLLDNMLIYAHD